MSGGRRPKIYHTMGTKVHTPKCHHQGAWQHEGRIDVPHSPYNLTPGPDHYFRNSRCGLSLFVQDFMGNGEKKCQKRPGTPAQRRLPAGGK